MAAWARPLFESGEELPQGNAQIFDTRRCQQSRGGGAVEKNTESTESTENTVKMVRRQIRLFIKSCSMLSAPQIKTQYSQYS